MVGIKALYGVERFSARTTPPISKLSSYWNGARTGGLWGGLMGHMAVSDEEAVKLSRTPQKSAHIVMLYSRRMKFTAKVSLLLMFIKIDHIDHTENVHAKRQRARYQRMPHFSFRCRRYALGGVLSETKWFSPVLATA